MSSSPTPSPIARASTPARHPVLRALGIFAAVLIVVVGGALWYASTAQFANRVRTEVIQVLERSTGGRVELAKFSWHLLKLEVEVDGLTIHGLEAPADVPYAHLDKLLVRAKIISLFRAQIGLRLLQVEHPVVHLIVYPDGSTNQPTPKVKDPSTGKPVTDEIFDLAVDSTQIDNGLVIFNQKKIPFNVAATDLSAKFLYVYANDHYQGSLNVTDLTAQQGKAPLVHSKLNLNVDLGRNVASLTGLHFASGDSSLEASANVKNFNDPHWQLAAKGAIDLREVAGLAQINGLGPGSLGLDISGQGQGSTLFDINGHASLKDADYKTSSVRLTGLNASTTVRLTQDAIQVPQLTIKLRQGGGIDGTAQLLHWMTPTPATTVAAAQKTTRPIKTKEQPEQQQAKIDLKLHGISAQTLLEMVAARKYQDLGFDTSLGGTAGIAWKGSIADVTANIKLGLAPPAPPRPGEVPVRGVLDATYVNHGGRLTVRQLDVHTPASSLNVRGAAGMYPATGPASLAIDLSLTNLQEFDRALMVAGVSANGKQGVAALPISLQGQAGFRGTLTGSLLAPDVKGHISAKQFSTTLPVASPAPVKVRSPHARVHGKKLLAADTRNPAPAVPAGSATPSAATPPAAAVPTTIQWDDLEADAEYSSSLIAIQQATLTKGKTAIHASGQLHAHALSRGRFAFDDGAALSASATIQNAAIPDLLSIAGQKLPVTGTLNLQAHAGGTLGNLNGGGQVGVTGGAAYGEPFKSFNADLQFAGKQVGVSEFRLLVAGGQVEGSGAYDTGNNSFHAKVAGTNFKLSNVQQLQAQTLHPEGSLTFNLQASGTVQTPSVTGDLHLNDLVLGGEKIGGLQAEIHTTDNVIYLSSHANIVNAQLVLAGQVSPRDDFAAKAQLSLSHLDVNPILTMLNVQGVKGHSIIDGTVNVAGPLKTPKLLEGDARISQFSVGVENLTLASQGPLHAALKDGTLTIDPLHISGQDTNLTAQGTIDLFSDSDERDVDLKAAGSIDVKIAQLFNAEILSSGKIDFNVAADGTMQQPDLSGQVKFTDVSLSYQEFPSGISELNGSLVFNQNRLDIRNLTGISGGGQVKLTGSLTYQDGIYSDVKVSASNVRFRYSGISTTADANLRLQGTPKSLLFDGNILITRFLVSPNIDLAGLTGTAASPPPNPQAFGNNLRLDVHVTSSPQLDFQNSFAQLAGSVDLRIRGTAAQPSILGSINITEGTATFSGTTYQLEHGDIYFTNPVRIEPTIDLDAVTRIEQYDVTIGLHGTADNLQPSFSSEPPLPQADVVSLLALGRTQNEQSIYSQQQTEAGVNGTTDALLGSALNATVSSRIQKLFGVGSIKIDPTYQGTLGETSARITVSQNIGKSVTAMFATNVNSSSQQLIQAQWNLNQNLSLTAVRDQSDVFSIIFKVHSRYR